MAIWFSLSLRASRDLSTLLMWSTSYKKQISCSKCLKDVQNWGWEYVYYFSKVKTFNEVNKFYKPASFPRLKLIMNALLPGIQNKLSKNAFFVFQMGLINTTCGSPRICICICIFIFICICISICICS